MKTPGHFARGGFTLIEMIVTLSIFLLLVGAVFEIFDATLQSAGTLQDGQARADQAEALGAWLRESFLSLPANGSIFSYRREGAPFDVSDVIWGSADQYNALDLHLQPDGHYSLRLAVSQPKDNDATVGEESAFAREVLNNDPALSWRVLLHDVTTADWRFLVPNDPQWHDATSGNRELIVQFSFQQAGATQPAVTDCWIPPLTAPGNAALTAPNNVTANP